MSTRVSRRSLLGLDLVNIFMADVRDGIGVYLSVYLLTVQHWDPAQIGLVIALPGVISVLAQSPIGHLIDRFHSKRLLLIASSVVVAISCLVVIFWPTFLPIALSQASLGIVGPLFQPCVSAVTLGLVGHKLMSHRVGRNEGFNHLGNLFAAVIAIFLGAWISFSGIFYLSLFQCAALIAAVAIIKPGEIDHERARAAPRGCSEFRDDVSFWRDTWALLKKPANRALILSLTLWNLANGTLLPLLGQKLSLGAPERSAYFLSLAIIVAQACMVFVAPWTARISRRQGFKPLFIGSFILIAVRAFLFGSLNNGAALIALQVLDGLAAGIYGVLSIVLMAEFSRGTGHFNLLQGLTYTCMGLGGALSSALGGYLVIYLGYDATFCILGALAIAGAAVFYRGVPEKRRSREPEVFTESASSPT